MRDSFGAAKATVTTLVSPPLGLLRPGLAAFDYSVGFARENLATQSFGYGHASAIAVHRRGMTPWLTLGARAEATVDVQNAGAMATAQVGHAVIEASGAVARSDAGVAPAASLAVGWQRRSLGVTSLVRAVGARYATLDLAATEDRTLLDAELSTSLSLGSHATVLATGAFEHRRDERDRMRAGVGANVRVWGDLSLLVSGAVSRSAETPCAIEGLVTLLTSVGGHTSASVRARATSAAVRSAAPRLHARHRRMAASATRSTRPGSARPRPRPGSAP